VAFDGGCNLLKMHNIPNIVRERLLRATPVGNHPDADILAAFAEKALAGRDRAEIIEHLARCGECRDVLAFALPETETQAVIVPAHGGWLTWPVLRWGFIAAGIVAIASLGVVQYQQRLRPATIAKATIARETPEKDTVAKNSTSPAPSGSFGQSSDSSQSGSIQFGSNQSGSTQAVDKQGGSSASRVLPPSVSATHPAPTMIQPAPAGAPQSSPAFRARQVQSFGNIGGPITRGPNMPSQWQQQQSSSGQIQTPAGLAGSAPNQPAVSNGSAGKPAVAETIEVTSAAVSQVQTQTAENSAENEVHGKQEQYDLSKAKSPVPAQTPAMQSQVGALSVNPALPRWTIDSAGGLQRSFDQGGSWQSVDVNALASSGLAKDSSAKESLANVQIAAAPTAEPNAAAKKHKAPLAPVFRAVFANGPDVWAGGSAGMLYHSTDAGNHWVRVMPSAAGIVLAVDIVAVEFSDTQHGRVTTSAAETWITSDGGQTWQKQ
jgi:hypothetical protein